MDSPTESLWKFGSATLRTFYNSPLKYNNNDLLDPLPEDKSYYKELPICSPFHLKSSSLDTSYKTYNPRFMEVVARSKRFTSILLSKKKLSKLPTVEKKRLIIIQPHGKILKKPKTTEKSESSLKIDAFNKLQKIADSIKEKYANLIKALEFKGDYLSFEAIVDYLRRSDIFLKRKDLKVGGSELRGRRNSSSMTYERGGLSRILHEKARILSEIFDTNYGKIVTRSHFISVLAIFEYGSTETNTIKLDLNNPEQLKSLNLKIQETKRIFRNFVDQKLMTREGFQHLLSTICQKSITDSIITQLSITSKVNFSQFLVILPLLLDSAESTIAFISPFNTINKIC